MEEAKRENQVEDNVKIVVSKLQENQQDQQNASVSTTATTSILKSCNKVLQWKQQANSGSSTVNKLAPSASVVPSAWGSISNHDSGKEP